MSIRTYLICKASVLYIFWTLIHNIVFLLTRWSEVFLTEGDGWLWPGLHSTQLDHNTQCWRWTQFWGRLGLGQLILPHLLLPVDGQLRQVFLANPFPPPLLHNIFISPLFRTEILSFNPVQISKRSLSSGRFAPQLYELWLIWMCLLSVYDLPVAGKTEANINHYI